MFRYMSAEWQFLITLNERLRPLKHPVAIQDAAARVLGEHLKINRVHYAHIEGDEFVISCSYVNGVPPLASRSPLAKFGAAMVDLCRRGETVVFDDVRSDPRLTDTERESLLSSQIAACVGSPLIKNGRWVATFAVHSATPRAWTSDQIALIELTAERTWGAGERARAEDALVRSESRQAFLLRLNDTIRPLADPARILHETCRLLGIHLGVNRVAYAEIADDDCLILEEYIDGVHPQPRRFPWRALGGSRATDILNGGTLTVNDTSAEMHTAEERAALHAADIGAYICPLLIKDGRFVGAFGIHNRTPRVWTRDEITLVQDVADRTWATLEHRKADADLRANEERLAFLLRLNDALRPLSDPTAVKETAARLLAEHLRVARVGYAELSGNGYAVHHEHARGAAPLVGSVSDISLGAILREDLRRGETVAVCDVQTDARLGDDERHTFRSRQIAAFVAAALFKSGRMVAAFGANNTTPRDWTAAEITLIRDVAERTWDAVERARVEAAIVEQEQRLRLALEASAGGSWTWVAATNEVDWDERLRALYGFSPDEPASADAWLPLVHEEDRANVLTWFNERLTSKTRDTWENTFRIVRRDGRVVWIQSRGRAERDAHGHLIRLTGLDLDFSQYRLAEEASQLQRDEEHDRTLRTLLDTATQGIVSIDARRVIVYANKAFEMMFGWTANDLLGQPIARLIPSDFPDGRDRRGGLQLVGMRKDSSTFPIEVNVNHVPTSGGGRAFAFVTDITEREERTTELERRTTQLSQMAWDLTLAEHHAREQIAKTLHDGLQQLLAIVKLNLDQQVKLEQDAGAAPSELLSVAKGQLDEAIAAARSLNLELFPPVLHRAGLPAALRWLSNWTREKYKLNVRVVADPRADSSRKDIRTLVFESVRELVFNAVKYSQADRVTLELAIDDADELCVTVKDEGVGFEPATLDERAKAGEMGWGLFRIRDRVTLLGGRFSIESAPGHGTRVRFVVPRRGNRSAVAGPRFSPARTDRAAADALKILIVDDHVAVRSALREMLQKLPQLSVVGDASNGSEAIANAFTLKPDVILMDVTMPQMDGIEATARIRAELPEIHILGLSMHARTETVHPIERAGAAGFFVKGFDTRRLIDHLLAFHVSRANRHRASS
ncbi:MAG TPA: GAF domain-containing protein [Vicinamibacterales bacterium]|nr:GAF domain-containing protein [Vicinamibacterales bacterium]